MNEAQTIQYSIYEHYSTMQYRVNQGSYDLKMDDVRKEVQKMLLEVLDSIYVAWKTMDNKQIVK